MYKLLLCWRYLLTRFIALASVISVMLGVATLIVVNSVMGGFRYEMESRMHDVLSDITVQSWNIDGFYDPEAHMAKIRKVADDQIDGMTTTVAIPAMMTFKIGDESPSTQVTVVGIDTKTIKSVGGVTQFLQHPANREAPTFKLHEDGYDTRNHIDPKDSAYRPEMKFAGWQFRRGTNKMKTAYNPGLGNQAANDATGQTSQNDSENTGSAMPPDIFDLITNAAPVQRFDPAMQQHTGAFLAIGISTYARGRMLNPETGKEELMERMRILPGDDVIISFPQNTKPPTFGTATFTISDMFECRMAEYDAKFLFVPIEKLQDLRGMIHPNGTRAVNQIMIKAKPGVDLEKLRDTIQSEFSEVFYCVRTWREHDPTLLEAVALETRLLNMLLFLIIAVAGFGILAIFYMIVLEKMRDIGILKALGASGFGVMQIFLYYSLTLGIVGAGLGTIIGLNIVWNINTIANWLSVLMGHEVFDPSVYMFSQIPTRLDPVMVMQVIGGSLLIAVIAGVLPAIRAARLHPVRALRFE